MAQQWHAEESAAKTIADVEALARHAENHDTVAVISEDSLETGEDSSSPQTL
jgi:hypothetical protein